MNEKNIVLIIALIVILAIVKTTVNLRIRTGNRERKPHRETDRSADGQELDLHSTDDEM